MNILGLFPSPVGISNIERPITEEEYAFIINQKRKSNGPNQHTSLDTKILNDPILIDIKNFIEDQLNVYLHKIYTPNQDTLKFRITQSWCNYLEQGHLHPRHTHSNSVVSGVFYPGVYNEDKLYFHSTNFAQLFVEPKECHLYNSTSWWIPVQTGQLVLFPSSLTHSVNYNQSKETRISLAFNTFFTGKLIDGELLSELIL